jgi:hypothetical protein
MGKAIPGYIPVATPARDMLGRFTSKAKPSTKTTVRTKAPYRINEAGSIVPFNGGTILGVVLAPSLKGALLKAGLVA